VVRLSRTAYYQLPVPASRRDAAVIAALTDAVTRYPRWGFWKLFDRLRVEGRLWNHTQRDKLRQELTLAELAAHEAKIEAFDVEGILGFAEHLLANAGRLWAEGALEQRQLIQRAIFPEGLPFDGREVGTGVTCLAFMRLPASDGVQNGMASPPGLGETYFEVPIVGDNRRAAWQAIEVFMAYRAVRGYADSASVLVFVSATR
jgi:putative transposase